MWIEILDSCQASRFTLFWKSDSVFYVLRKTTRLASRMETLVTGLLESNSDRRPNVIAPRGEVD